MGAVTVVIIISRSPDFLEEESRAQSPAFLFGNLLYFILIMDNDLRKLVEENLVLSRETHEMVKGLERSARWGRFFTLLYWALIIASVVGAYYFIQPYLNATLGAYQGILSGVDQIQSKTQSLPDSQALKSLLDNFR